jgi:hypothetical protein
MLKHSEPRRNAGSAELKEERRAKREVIAADRRALRVLLDTFLLEPETRLDDRLGDPSVRREIGKLISRHFRETYW